MRNSTVAVIGTAGAHALELPFPAVGDNPYLDLIAYNDPGIHAAIRLWYYASAGVAVILAGSLILSVWRIWLQPLVRFRRRGKLPKWPTSPNDDAPSLVIGETHHPTVPRESERLSWLVVPEKGLYTGVLVVGAVGTGKTTACMYPFAKRASWFRLFPMRAIWRVRSRSTARADAVQVRVRVIASRSNADGDTPAATAFSRQAPCSAGVTRAATITVRCSGIA